MLIGIIEDVLNPEECILNHQIRFESGAFQV